VYTPVSKQSPLQFTLITLLAALSYLCLAFGASQALNSPAVAVHLSLLFVGWVLGRFAHANLFGLILLLIGIDILFISGISWAYHGYEFFPHEIILSTGSIFVTIAICVFAFLAFLKKEHWQYQASIAVGTTLLLAGWWTVVPNIGNAAVASRQRKEIKANNTAMTKAVAQIELLRRKLGRIPEESELDDLLTEPLPEINWDGWNTRIKYHKSNEDSYLLWYTNWDVYYYDSSTPKKGWFSEPF
jgi:hypothetical protein